MIVRKANPAIENNYGMNLLKSRGIDDVEWYLNPTEPKYLQNPEALDNIVEGGKRLMETIESTKKKLLLIVDCDADGFTSAAIIYGYIKKIHPNLEIDYWLHEGKQHGLEDHIDHLLEVQDEYSLVIIPDASSNDYEYHIQLKIPCLVLDHHLAEPPFAPNAVIINNQLSPEYINKELTGAGVVWQFCKYIDKTYGYNFADDFTDLAAWGIIGDMGSVLSYENRYIIYHGLKNVKNFFFKTLIEKQSYSMEGVLSPTTVAFYIVPLINAMIRVGTMEQKERLFIAFIDGERLIPSGKRGAKGTLDTAAAESVRECTNAKNKQNKIKEEAVETLKIKISKYDLLSNKILFVRLDEEDFPPEIVGLIAMQLSAEFKKPTIVARLNDQGFIRGSARGLNQSQLTSFKKYLDSTKLFEYAEGHDNAFGISIPDKNLGTLHKLANEELAAIDFGESAYDVNFEFEAWEAGISDVIFDLEEYKTLWGQNNEEALIYINRIAFDKSDIRIMGQNSDTVKITHNGISYMKFHAKDFIQELAKCDSPVLNIIGKAKVNHWGGKTEPQIFIQNYELIDKLLEF